MHWEILHVSQQEMLLLSTTMTGWGDTSCIMDSRYYSIILWKKIMLKLQEPYAVIVLNLKYNLLIYFAILCSYDDFIIILYCEWFDVHISCLSFENVFSLQVYELNVLETKPGKAVSIIETDMNVRPNSIITLVYVYL